jgi:inner membrane protein
MELSSVWMWAAVAMVLLVGEMMTTTLGLLFFGVAAAVTAVIVIIKPDLPPAVQLIIFGVLGLAGLLGGRKWIKAKLSAKAAPAFTLDSNTEFAIDRDLAPGAEGAVLYQGTPWSAKNEGNEPIKQGDRVKVIRTNGIKLIIQKVR